MKILSTLGAVTAAGALTLGALVAPAAQAAPVARQAEATAAADWLYGQLDDGRMGSSFDPSFTDWGLTVDTLWALIAAGADADRVTEVADAVEANASDYTSFGIEGYYASGSVGKLIVAAQSVGRDPADFGGLDLVGLATDAIGPDGQVASTLESGERTGGAANTFAQSLIVMGLAEEDALPGEAVDFLITQQCADGFFVIFPDPDGRGCDAAGGQPDRDATAMAIMALYAAGGDDATASAARAVAWLITEQRDDGSFGGGVSTEGANANSTGLVAAALATAGEDEAAAAAGEWVAGLQLDTGSDAGAIAYNAESFAAGGADGNDQWRRASAQAIFAFVPVSLTELGRGPAPTPQPSTASPSASPSPSTSPSPTASASSTVSASPTVPPSSSASATPSIGAPPTVSPTSDATASAPAAPNPDTATPPPSPGAGPLADTGAPAIIGLLTAGLLAVGAGARLLRRH